MSPDILHLWINSAGLILAASTAIGSLLYSRKKVAKVEQNVQALDWKLSAEDLRALDEALAASTQTAG